MSNLARRTPRPNAAPGSPMPRILRLPRRLSVTALDVRDALAADLRALADLAGGIAAVATRYGLPVDPLYHLSRGASTPSPDVAVQHARHVVASAFETLTT